MGDDPKSRNSDNILSDSNEEPPAPNHHNNNNGNNHPLTTRPSPTPSASPMPTPKHHHNLQQSKIKDSASDTYFGMNEEELALLIVGAIVVVLIFILVVVCCGGCCCLCFVLATRISRQDDSMPSRTKRGPKRSKKAVWSRAPSLPSRRIDEKGIQLPHQPCRAGLEVTRYSGNPARGGTHFPPKTTPKPFLQ